MTEAPAEEQTMSPDEQAIRTLVATWIAASAADDRERVLGLMAEDVVFLVAGQPPMRGRAAFAAAQQALEGFKIDATAEIQEVRVFGDWAYCWNKLQVAIAPPDGRAPVKRAGHVLSILNKQAGGNWVIVRDANMLSTVAE